MSTPARRLLVLDDEPLSRGLVESIVSPEGFAVRASGDPREAVAWARQNPGGVMLVDIMLGVIEAIPRWQRRRSDPTGGTEVVPDDGYAMLRPVDADPSLGRCAVVLLRDPREATGWSDPLRFAVIGYVPKPVDGEELLRRLRGIYLQSPAGSRRPDPTPGFDLLPRALRVALVVDPDPSFRSFIRGLLEPPGFTVIEASDGEEGLERAKARRPWLILTEANLAKMDGFEFCRQVRRHSLLRHTPLVFFSSWDDFSARYHGVTLGADDYFSKGTPSAEILVRLQILLSRYADVRGRRKTDAGLEGGIELIGATGLLQMCHLSRFTGTCTVRSGERWVQVRLRDGEVLGARSPLNDGEKAIFELLAWTRGHFEFVSGDPGLGEPIARFDYLLLEGCRLLDEAERADAVGARAADAQVN
jgi:DNA-binding response OmpR family regulator